MALSKGYRQLIDEAAARIETVPVAAARALLDDPDVVFVDIRDVRELERDGMIPGAFHAPRGMLEFWVDPDSPYFKEVFGSGKRFILYCASAWRSSLATATLQDMGWRASPTWAAALRPGRRPELRSLTAQVRVKPARTRVRQHVERSQSCALGLPKTHTVRACVRS